MTNSEHPSLLIMMVRCRPTVWLSVQCSDPYAVTDGWKDTQAVRLARSKQSWKGGSTPDKDNVKKKIKVRVFVSYSGWLMRYTAAAIGHSLLEIGLAVHTGSIVICQLIN